MISFQRVVSREAAAKKMTDPEVLQQATKERYRRTFEYVRTMRVRQKRNLFCILRARSDVTSDTFLPTYGLHCGEFACFQILTEHLRKESRKEDMSAGTTPRNSDESAFRIP